MIRHETLAVSVREATLLLQRTFNRVKVQFDELKSIMYDTDGN